jgi:hypothetical protein
MSIIRVGLAETKKYAEGYEAIFGKKDADQAKPEEQKTDTAKQDEKKDETKAQ